MRTIFGVGLLAFLTGQVSQPPPLLTDVLRTEGLEIVDPDRHFPGRGYTRQELVELGAWSPWVSLDVDGDRRRDVIAAVARRKGDQLLFGVVAVHAREPRRVRWVEVPASDVIHGVVADPSGSITPLHCVECDANPWYRWSGRSYEAGLYARGEEIVLATAEKDVRLGLFERPDRASKLIAQFEECTTTATVLESRGNDYPNRWYLVELKAAVRTRGWIPTAFAADANCV